MFIILFSLILIIFSCKELCNVYFSHKRIKKVDTLFNGGAIPKKAVTKKVDERNAAFERLIAKNSTIIGFFYRFQTENAWKIYAMVMGFSLFFITNELLNWIEIDQTSFVMILVAMLFIVIFVPNKIVKMQVNRRIKSVSRDLPIVIDMMAIMVKSGMTVENSFKYLSKRIMPINRDVAAILERACLMMDVNGIESAVDMINREVPSKEMRLFCITLKRSVQYGNSIYETLLELSSEIREIQKLDIEEKIAAISAKMTLPMMGFILLPVLVAIVAPIIMNLLSIKFV